MQKEIPKVDITQWLESSFNTSEQIQQLGDKVAKSFVDYGCVIILDPRVSIEDNNEFLDMMERYFEQPYNKKLQDQRPDVSYQLGVTPGDTELPRSVWDKKIKQYIDSLPADMKPITPTQRDCKWRYIWKLTSRSEEKNSTVLHRDLVIPEGFSEWQVTMDTWGDKLKDACASVCQLLAIGLGLPTDAFKNLMAGGRHILAPTGSDLNKYGKLNQILAGFHYDMGFVAVHGKSKFPGLNIWLKDGTKMAVKVPQGCLLLQAAQQLEYLTGGLIKAGFHEVVVSQDTLDAIELARQQKRSLWRATSIVLVHISPDAYLEPLGKYATPETLEQYPRILAAAQIQNELEALSLGDVKY